MKVIEPIDITPAMLISTNVPETDHPPWSSATTYAAAARVIKNHRIWESVQAANTNHDPETDTTSTWWVNVGATNRWRAFDGRLSSKTTRANSISYALTLPATTGAIVLLGLDAASARITVTDPVEGVIYDRTFGLISDLDIYDAWEYFFADFTAIADLVVSDLPAWSGSEIGITISGGPATAVGEILIGRETHIGTCLTGTVVGQDNYSLIERDPFGNATVVPRGYARRVEYHVGFPTDDMARLDSLVSRIRDRPCVFHAGEGTDRFATTVFGIIGEFSTPLTTSRSFASFEVKGMV